MTRKSYPTDLTDMEWEILAPLIPPAKEGGHPRTTDMREICNAIYYHLKTGCHWKKLKSCGLTRGMTAISLLASWLMIQAHVEVMGRTDKEFEVLPKRWVVERTFGWFNQYHRLSKDYERLTPNE
ncbi:transposase [Calothrix sp. NIES-2100]|nr:transposase [Calothrix sp. NIES-2100]